MSSHALICRPGLQATLGGFQISHVFLSGATSLTDSSSRFGYAANQTFSQNMVLILYMRDPDMFSPADIWPIYHNLPMLR